VSGVPNAMQGFSQNRDQPIQIEAASLEMRDKKKEATFTGNVKVVQGDTTMTSKSPGRVLRAVRAARRDARTGPTRARSPARRPRRCSRDAGPGGSSNIRRLEAKGNVVVTQKDQVVTGETAIFDTKANLITMTGGVVLTQCKNVLRGDRLLVDMTTAYRGWNRTAARCRVCSTSRRKGCAAAPGAPPAPAEARASLAPFWEKVRKTKALRLF
jgi:lipopolysaccharide export system protein LptA